MSNKSHSRAQYRGQFFLQTFHRASTERTLARTRRMNERDHVDDSPRSRSADHKQSPFAFPSCSQTVAHHRWWRERKKRAMRHGSQKKDRRDIDTQSLHVQAMTDVNPEYFTELAGRSVREKFSLERYVRDNREILKSRLLVGQQTDDCIRIRQQFEQESRRLRKLQHRLQGYTSGFEEFLSNDHQHSMDMLEKAEQQTKLAQQITIRRNELSKEYGEVRLEIYVWEENWRTVKMCQTFLHRLSPMDWRMKRDQHTARKSMLSTDLMQLRQGAPDENASLEDLIELFECDVADAGATELYFDDPFDLVGIFRTMETHNLNALTHLESLAKPLADTSTAIAVTEARIDREISEISWTIDELQTCIVEAEDRAANLEQSANHLLRDVFRHLVCSEAVLHLRVFVEDTYESIARPNDANLDSRSMMKWIERIHEQLNLQLDNLPHRVVRVCEREGFERESKATKESEDAARKFELMHRLLDALKRIMEPPWRLAKRPLIRRSTPLPLKAKPSSSLSVVSPATNQHTTRYLAFFAD